MKGQIQQVFIYIAAILVIGFLVIIGAKAILGVINNKCQVEEGSFLRSLESELAAGERFGTQHTAHLRAPCEYEVLCIIDANSLGHVITLADIDHSEEALAIISANAKDKIPYNVYLFETGRQGKIYPAAYDTRLITTLPDVEGSQGLCFVKKNGEFTFRIEGVGRPGILVKSLE